MPPKDAKKGGGQAATFEPPADLPTQLQSAFPVWNAATVDAAIKAQPGAYTRTHRSPRIGEPRVYRTTLWATHRFGSAGWVDHHGAGSLGEQESRATRRRIRHAC
jgi:hypothetical protein